MTEKHVNELDIQTIIITIGIALTLGVTVFSDGMFTGNNFKAITGFTITFVALLFYTKARKKSKSIK